MPFIKGGDTIRITQVLESPYFLLILKKILPYDQKENVLLSVDCKLCVNALLNEVLGGGYSRD